MRHRYFRLAAVVLALVGYWSPWLTHPAAALRLNGYELSEWITFLPGVRSGELSLSRLTFLLPLACLALLLCAVATRVPIRLAPPPLGQGSASFLQRPRPGMSGALPAVPGPWGWVLLAAGAVCALVLFPPYPYLLTAVRDPEFQAQFFVACATLLAVAILAYLPAVIKDGLQLVLGLAGAGLSVFAMLSLRTAAAELLNAPWPIGAGWVALVAGFGALALSGLAQLFGARE